MIPPFTNSGVVEPWWDQQLQRPGRSGGQPVAAFFSPHQTDLVEMVNRLGMSPHRRNLLSGFIRYREHLRSIGLVNSAIQWVGGSFVETKPEPSDIDVLTLFFPTQPAPKDRTLWLQAFGGPSMKQPFFCDAYGVQVNPGSPVLQVLAYWLGLLSHRRITEEWKGMLMIPLDAVAAKDLEASKIIREQGVSP